MTVTMHNGVIADTPELLTDLIRVTIPDLTTPGRKTFGPMHFNSVISGDGEIMLPQRGDSAVIAVDEGSGPSWVIFWYRDDE